MKPRPIESATPSTIQFAVFEVDVDQIHRARRERRLVLIIIDRPDQPMRHGDDRLIDPRPVLLVALAKLFPNLEPTIALNQVLSSLTLRS